MKLVSFSEAIAAMEEGKMVTREDMPSNMFLFKRSETEVKPDIVPKMNSLPQAVKQRLEDTGYSLEFFSQINQVVIKDEDETAYITNYDIQNADVFGEQWIVL